MSSEAITPHGFHQRNFGHCIVSWKIKNYFLAACNPGREIKSNPFYVHSWQDTHWQIFFRVKLGNRSCQVLLKRCIDEADEEINVTWRVTMFDGNGIKCFIYDDRFSFTQSSQRAMNVPDPFHLPGVLDSELHELRIEIQMIVNMNARMRFPTLGATDLQSLVNDLKFARKNLLYPDLTIRLNDENIRGHKAMLLTRSKTLEQAEGDRNTKTYFIYKGDNRAFDSLVDYLYTSDLFYIFATPSFSIYNLIVELNITELLDAYPQEKITMETIIDETEFQYRWSTPNFIYKDRIPNINIYEASGRNSNGIDWRLRIFPKEVAEDAATRVKYFYIEASIVNNAEPQDIVICIKARNSDDQTIVVKRTYGKIERDMKLGTKLMRLDNPSKSCYTLDISFSVHIPAGTRKTISEGSTPVNFWLNYSGAFNVLQNHLKDLFEKSLYSDITLLLEEHEFKCHKFLLAARSSAFFSLIEERGGASLPFRNINRKVFSAFLYYLYTGSLPDLVPETTSELSVIFLMHLYELSMNFTVNSLTALCLNRLKNQVVLKNSCCMLLFAVQRRLTELKSNVIRLLSLHPEFVIHRMCKTRLEAKSPDIFRFVPNHFKTSSHRSDFDLDAELFVPELLGLNSMVMCS